MQRSFVIHVGFTSGTQHSSCTDANRLADIRLEMESRKDQQHIVQRGLCLTSKH